MRTKPATKIPYRATERPWIQRTKVPVAYSGLPQHTATCSIENARGTRIIGHLTISTNEDKANADLILKAVNFHDRLIDLLHDHESAWNDEEDSVQEEHAELIERTRAMLREVSR